MSSLAIALFEARSEDEQHEVRVSPDSAHDGMSFYKIDARHNPFRLERKLRDVCTRILRLARMSYKHSQRTPESAGVLTCRLPIYKPFKI